MTGGTQLQKVNLNGTVPIHNFPIHPTDKAMFLYIILVLMLMFIILIILSLLFSLILG